MGQNRSGPRHVSLAFGQVADRRRGVLQELFRRVACQIARQRQVALQTVPISTQPLRRRTK
jgi:hypothetical protein